ncbi:pah3 homeobox protein encoded by the pah3 protein [Podospora australis]|uniref:Pah3 homeobox protein encoded by the pah3 protein n=1 Tax=Podospora australis TaxID=1536484 RepID=A0AAN7AJ26_9PEZI|nr:pah3 homeobox protein encoded by the pah3 protein [Podospora australis]
MDMDFMDPYRRPYQGMGYGAQQHAQQQAHQYPYWSQHLVAYYQQQQHHQHQHRAAAMMGQGPMQMSKQTEPKPRLAKDEVELLEREFAKNPKPNSSTKRELAEQMGVEVPRINNWFQNRRAKEKQMKKTAEFEAQQAREREASESKSSEDQDEVTVSEFYGLSNQHRPLGLSKASFGDSDGGADSDHDESGQESLQQPNGNSSADSDNEDPAHLKYEQCPSPDHASRATRDLETPPTITSSFNQHEYQHQAGFQQPTPYSFRQGASHLLGLAGSDLDAHSPHERADMRDSSALNMFPDRDYFASGSVPSFPSEMFSDPMPGGISNGILRHETSVENLIKPEPFSPHSMPDSPSTVSDLRFKSPPPPADIAGRRMRRPAPLPLSSLRGGVGPKTGIEAPRRIDTASPMRRISSTSGLSGRVQKSFMGPGGPRSPFAMDRNKEALLQSLQGAQSPIMSSLNSAMSPMSPGASGQSIRENTVTTNASDEESAFAYGSLGAVSGVSMYKTEPAMKTPPGTPGLRMGLQEAYFPHSVDQAWNYAPQDEPLPTPSLCSHGGSELEFSMAPQMPGYVASQPATPSFPSSIGPTYNGFFGPSLAHTEYHFPDAYGAESSARSSPAGPPRSKQFQFAQNVTPQDFTEK